MTVRPENVRFQPARERHPWYDLDHWIRLAVAWIIVQLALLFMVVWALLFIAGLGLIALRLIASLGSGSVDY